MRVCVGFGWLWIVFGVGKVVDVCGVVGIVVGGEWDFIDDKGIVVGIFFLGFVLF